MLHRYIGCVLVLLAAGPCYGQDMKLTDILIDGEGWKEAQKAVAPIRWLQTDRDGKLLVVDGAAGDPKEYPPRTVTARGGYSYSIKENTIRMRPPGSNSSDTGTIVKVEGLERPVGLVVWPDGGTLVVGDAGGAALWAFRIEKDGNLTGGDRYYYPVRSRPGHPCGVTDLAVDKVGRVYAATTEGVQVFDPTGRLIGVLAKPAAGAVSGVALGGPDGDTLFVGCGDKVYARKTRARSVWAKDPGK
jgi:sugar lactone lactonase YvrE